jgi:hypothetical protein
MVDPVIFPDTVDAVITWLDQWMDVPVRSKVPNPRPDAFITVTRTGGPQRNLVTDEAQITVESWGRSDAEAHDLAQDARGLINSIIGETVNGTPFYRVTELSGPANLPDPLSNQPRQSQSFAVAARGYTRTGS